MLQAARFVTRSMFRTRARVLWGLIVLVVVGCGCVAGWLWLVANASARPRVNYALELQTEARSLPDGERAWLVYRKLLAQLEACAEWSATSPGFAGWPEQAERVRAHDAILAQVGPVTEWPSFGLAWNERTAWLPGEEPSDFVPLDSRKEPLTRVSAPALGSIRRLARLVNQSGEVKREDGALDAAAERFLATAMLGFQAARNGVVVQQLSGWGCAALGLGSLDRLLEERGRELSDATLIEIARSLDREPERLRLQLSDLRIQCLDSMQHAYGSGIAGVLGGDQLTAATVQQIVGSPWWTDQALEGLNERGEDLAQSTLLLQLLAPSRRAAEAQLGRLLEAIERDAARLPWDRSPGFVDSVPQLSYEVLVPALAEVRSIAGERVLSTPHLLTLRRNATRLRVALEQAHRAGAATPASVESLHPRFLAHVPRDPSDGRPLRLALRDVHGVRSLVVYALGPDGSDHGGTAAESEPLESGASSGAVPFGEAPPGSDVILFHMPAW